MTHGSFELDADAAKLIALGADPGPEIEDLQDTYTCAHCKNVYLAGRSFAEAEAELAVTFPGKTPAECDIICDDCFNKMGVDPEKPVICNVCHYPFDDTPGGKNIDGTCAECVAEAGDHFGLAAIERATPMTPMQYIKNAVRTKSDRFNGVTTISPTLTASATIINIDVLHAIIGVATEGGELLDVVKKNMFYGKPVDYVNLDEEMGDVLWYLAIYFHARGISFEAVMQTNIDKLRKRFPDKFTQEQALNRDLDAERELLERGTKAAQAD